MFVSSDLKTDEHFVWEISPLGKHIQFSYGPWEDPNLSVLSIEHLANMVFCKMLLPAQSGRTFMNIRVHSLTHNKDIV